MKYKLSVASNVLAPAYALLVEKGFKVYKDQDYFVAENKKVQFKAEGTIQLLGLVSLYEEKGEEWQVDDTVIDHYLKKVENLENIA